MKSRAERGSRHRWGEVLLGSLMGLGVPMVLLGLARRRGLQGSPVAVGTIAGLLGALVGGGLARRPRGEPMLPLEDAPEPRRGPNGRERPWHLEGAVAHTWG
jgi:hypothetical protein